MPRRSEQDAGALLERFRRHLRERRLPVTKQRLAVAELMFHADDHPSAGQLEARLSAAGVAVGTATLYRTLDVLMAMGLVRAPDFGEGFARYEASPGAPHDHLVCERCGKVLEFDGERLERMLRVTADEAHFLYRRHRIDVHGLCRECRERDLDPVGAGAAR